MSDQCHCACQHALEGRSAGTTRRPRTEPSRRFAASVGAVSGLVDPERLARLERAGMPPHVARNVITHTHGAY